MAASITVVIHTHNEEKNIQECIDSARLLTKEIHIIDMDSNDRSQDIAKKNGIKVLNVPFTTYVEPARKFGIMQSKSDWVFLLDADERMTPELAQEIKEKILPATSHQLPATHYKVPRKNIFGRKQWLKHGGWWPDHQIRLIHKKSLKDWPEKIHSTPQIEGDMDYLANPFIHYFHGDLQSMVDKTTIYENIESQLLYEAGRPAETKTFFRKFLGELFRRLIQKKGYLDGTIGVIESIYQAYSKTITYLYVYEKKKSSSL